MSINKLDKFAGLAASSENDLLSLIDFLKRELGDEDDKGNGQNESGNEEPIDLQALLADLEKYFEETKEGKKLVLSSDDRAGIEKYKDEIIRRIHSVKDREIQARLIRQYHGIFTFE